MMRVHLMRARPGFSLVELIVAMVLLSVTLVALAATGMVAARSFTQAATSEAAVRAAAQVIDSLVRVPSPTAGSRTIGHVDLMWTVAGDGAVLTIDVSSHHRGTGDTLVFHTARPAVGEPAP
ncbi:MAG TPA: prepilin-type N-terminal cleavage/methylation domain-containing protein [Longimicrobiales bacterium]|nr:prepilin-type N-terminal cleavage/methylation domain-containing protein [Longimicrobiales bacterium]